MYVYCLRRSVFRILLKTAPEGCAQSYFVKFLSLGHNQRIIACETPTHVNDIRFTVDHKEEGRRADPETVFPTRCSNRPQQHRTVGSYRWGPRLVRKVRK